MTGIERLRQFAKGCRIAGQNAYSNDITAIADHIEREQGGRVSRMRVLSVVTEMERHVLGHEGMEDSPVARWARELREALDGERRDRAADVSVSAYDLLPQEDREAIAWVREHGGLERVKAQRRESMPRAAYERKKAGFLDHIAECEAALGRRREIISELNHRASDLTRENAELRKRAMPEGCQWPRHESGEPVWFGDGVSRNGEDFEVKVIALYCDGSFSLNFWAYSKDERVKRPAPKVYDADGVEIREDDRVWNTHLDEPHEWIVIDPHEDRDDSQTVLVSIGDRTGHARPSDLTHRAPVLAADGRPLREGGHVYHVETGAELVVKELPKPGEYQAVVVFAPPASHLTSFDPDQLTHERPDSWERLEEDASKETCEYFGSKHCDCSTCKRLERSVKDCGTSKARDIVRRARALAERERGE